MSGCWGVASTLHVSTLFTAYRAIEQQFFGEMKRRVWVGVGNKNLSETPAVKDRALQSDVFAKYARHKKQTGPCLAPLRYTESLLDRA